MKLGPVERDVAAEEALRIRQQHGRSAGQWHVTVRDGTLQRQHRRHRVQVRRVRRQLIDVDEAEVVVAVRNLRRATGIDHIDLGGHLIARAEPGLRNQGECVRGVVVGEDLGRMQRQLLCGIPDPVVGAGLAEVVSCRGARGALCGDDRRERFGCAVDDIVAERILEYDDARPVGQCAGQLALQCPPIRMGGGLRGVDEHVLAYLAGQGVVGEGGVPRDLGAEGVEVAVRLLDPRRAPGGDWCNHAR